MNEKIKQLAEQAGYSKDFLAIGLPNNMEKFAELIIRECADVCYRIDGEYDGEDIMATWCAEGILKHFGDEE